MTKRCIEQLNHNKVIQTTYNGLPVEIERKKIKNMYLKVLPPDGRLHISAPVKMSKDAILRFIASKAEWIKEHQDKFAGRGLPTVAEYATGENILLWGKAYSLVVNYSSGSNHIDFDEGRVILSVKDASDISTVIKRAGVLKQWYHGMLYLKIPNLLEKWQQIIGVRADSWYIRDMKTRWGTCNIRNKRICLNLQLIKKDPECLEYVVVHELVHLLEKSHNKVFKAYMDHFLPEWKEIKARLNSVV